MILRGAEAQKFIRQVKYGRPKKAAHKALERGNKLLSEYLEKGYATIKVGNDPNP
jgi:hypothetical protein